MKIGHWDIVYNFITWLTWAQGPHQWNSIRKILSEKIEFRRDWIWDEEGGDGTIDSSLNSENLNQNLISGSGEELKRKVGWNDSWFV